MTGSRFYDRQSGEHGPVTGALQLIPLNLETAVGNSDVITQQVHMPVGGKFKVTDVTVFCGTVTSDPVITVGTTATGTQICASATLATGSNALTVKSYTPAATGIISVVITADAGDAIALPVSVTIAGYNSAPPTAVDFRP